MTTRADTRTSNPRLLEWVDKWVAILQPDAIHWCDGSQDE